MLKISGKTCLKAAAIGAALMTSTSALAQWQGTWGTSYGDVKLQESGKYVYGDYGTWGTIEGLKSDDGKTMRGVYRRNDDGTYGYFEWRMAGSVAFVGRWVKPNQTLPKWNSGGTEWAGNRKSTASPRLVVYRGGGNIGAFMGAQQAKYQRWAGSLYASSSTSSTTAAPPKKAVNPLAKRFPKLADYPANFTPRWFEISFTTLHGGGQAEFNPEFFGIIGIYAYCETARGSRSLTPFGGLKARVFDQPRNNPARVRGKFPSTYYFGEQTRRKFPVDQQCLNDPDARLKVQLQTNLKEKNVGGGPRDAVYGYRSLSFYLDHIPASQGETRTYPITESDYVRLYAEEGRTALFTARASDPEGWRNRASDFSINGNLRFTQ